VSFGVDLRHAQHAVHHLVGRRHPDHVLAGLADLRLVGLLLRGGRQAKASAASSGEARCVFSAMSPRKKKAAR
jgi:hypothetical protein